MVSEQRTDPLVRKTLRRAFQSDLWGFQLPANFSIKTCLRWRTHRYERATLQCLRAALPSGSVFVDIGAHVGYHAARAARWVGKTGRVFAFEPHPGNYRLLAGNTRRMPQIVSMQVAVSDSEGQAVLFEHSVSTTSHALTDLSGSGRSVPVRTVCLDAWALEQGVRRVDVVLIDVEGHELPVLRGMRRLVAANPDITIVLEYCPSHWTSRSEVMDALLSEIHGMCLQVTRVLGQKSDYTVPDDGSAPSLAERLASAVRVETEREQCDYVNLVVRRRA